MNKDEALLKLGNKIRYERMKRKLSQEELAEISDLNMRSISTLECGKNDVRFFTLTKLAEAFEMEISTLLDFRL